MTRIDHKRMQNLSHEELRRCLSYDQMTGHFSWLIHHGRSSIGDRAGGINSNGYLTLKLNGYVYMQHRLAWMYVTGEWPSEEIDHVNQVRSDNRFINLRQASRVDNMQNRPIRSDNTSGYPGVYFDKNRKRWRAEIYHNGKKMQIGMFEDLELAIFVREHVDAKIKCAFVPSYVLERISA